MNKIFKIHKKIMSMALAMTMMLSLFSMQVFADEVRFTIEEGSGYTYDSTASTLTITEAGTYNITTNGYTTTHNIVISADNVTINLNDVVMETTNTTAIKVNGYYTLTIGGTGASITSAEYTGPSATTYGIVSTGDIYFVNTGEFSITSKAATTTNSYVSGSYAIFTSANIYFNGAKVILTSHEADESYALRAWNKVEIAQGTEVVATSLDEGDNSVGSYVGEIDIKGSLISEGDYSGLRTGSLVVDGGYVEALARTGENGIVDSSNQSSSYIKNGAVVYAQGVIRGIGFNGNLEIDDSTVVAKATNGSAWWDSVAIRTSNLTITGDSDIIAKATYDVEDGGYSAYSISAEEIIIDSALKAFQYDGQDYTIASTLSDDNTRFVYGDPETYTTDVRIYIPNYTVSYNLESDESATDLPIDEEIERGQTVTVTDVVPTKTGYTFDGWEYEGTTYQADETLTMPASDVTFTATWSINDHILVFKDGNTMISEEEVDFGTNVVIPSHSKEGYTFTGWYYDGSTYQAGETFTMPNEGVEFTATWSVIDYTVSFDANGGAEVSSYNVDFNTQIILPDTTKEGAHFYGWIYNGATYQAGEMFTMPASDVTFTAIWLPHEATPNATIDYVNEQILGLNTAYTINGDTVLIDGNIDIDESWFATELSIVKTGDGVYTVDSDTQILAIPARPTLDTVSAVNCTTTSNNNGKITGVDSSMYYRISGDTAWYEIPYGTTEITGLTNGTYEVYIPAVEGVSFASQIKTVTIAKKTGSSSNSSSSTATLDRDNHYAYMQGNDDGTFTPDNYITRVEAAVMFSRLLTEKIDDETLYSSSFSDITEDLWYANAVGFMEQFGVINGYEDGTFGGDNAITRAEFATIASRFDELALSDQNIFSDVSQSHWAFEYISSAEAKGWINGYEDGTFKPEQFITRAEAVTLVNKVLDRSCDQDFIIENFEDINTFSDVTSSHWAYYEILEASNGHIYKVNNGVEYWTALVD
ncbi:MAG: S-layer homology domain-containing protein [Clostridia bacterium]